MPPFELPIDVPYNRRRPIYVAIFAVVFFTWKIFQNLHGDFIQTLSSPFTWILPAVLLFTAWKMWNRIILRIEETDIWVYPLFGPGKRRYSYGGFDKLVIMQGRLYIIKPDPDTEDDRGVFVIACWALDQEFFPQLADYLKEVHGIKA